MGFGPWPLSSVRPNLGRSCPKGRRSLIPQCDRVRTSSLPSPALVGRVVPHYSSRQPGRVTNKSGGGLPHPLVSAPWVSRCDSLIVATTVFGMPVLLKRKDNKVPVDVAPLPSQPSPPNQPSLPPPTAKHPRRDQELVVR